MKLLLVVTLLFGFSFGAVANQRVYESMATCGKDALDINKMRFCVSNKLKSLEGELYELHRRAKKKKKRKRNRRRLINGIRQHKAWLQMVIDEYQKEMSVLHQWEEKAVKIKK